MTDQEIKSNLCYYDRENPNNNLDVYDEEDRPRSRNGCGCDNCFYGRDKLAMQILETQRERDEERALADRLAEIVEVGIEDLDGGDWPEAFAALAAWKGARSECR